MYNSELHFDLYLRSAFFYYRIPKDFPIIKKANSTCISSGSHWQSILSLSVKTQKKHETGFEPATLALARRYSTTEPLVHLSCLRAVRRKQDIYYMKVLCLSTLFFNFFIFFVTVQPKKDKSIIHELAHCMLNSLFMAEYLYLKYDTPDSKICWFWFPTIFIATLSPILSE